MTSLAEKAFTTNERIAGYELLMRQLVPGWQLTFQRATAQMRKAYPAAADPNGSLRDLATFILAANASENAQVSLLSAQKIARNAHPMSHARFGT